MLVTGIIVPPHSCADEQKIFPQGHLQIAINNTAGPPCPMKAIIWVDDKKKSEIESDKYIDMLFLEYNTPYKISVQVFAESPEYAHVFPYRGENTVTNYKVVEVENPRSRMEINIEYDENVLTKKNLKPQRIGRVTLGEVTEYFDTDLDNFIDDIEKFFGTNITDPARNPSVLDDMVIIKKNNERLFISNKRYIPAFSESRTILEDMNEFDKNADVINERIVIAEERLLIEKMKSTDDNGLIREKRGDTWFTYNKEETIRAYTGQCDSLRSILGQIAQEKQTYMSNFLSESNLYKFEIQGDTLKIYHMKYNDQSWQDITLQPEHYKMSGSY
jgi:hypothetical protein